MKEVPDYLDVSITDEVRNVPFEAFGWNFDLSAFKIQWRRTENECICLHRGDLLNTGKEGVPVRIHSSCLTGETLGSQMCDCAWQLQHALQCIVQSKKGALIYLPWQEGRGNGLVQKVKSFKLMNAGMTTFEAFTALGIPVDNRDYTPALAILLQLGLTKIQLITNNPAKIKAVQDAGIEVVRRIPSVKSTMDPHLLRYFNSKAHQLGHLINGGGL